MSRLLLIVCLLLPLAVWADERILDFQSDVIVSQDGSIEVTETITVRAEGQRIRRGIYRDFPTRYLDTYGNNVEVSYEPLAVLRNDDPEDFHSERISNGVRTYFGHPDRMLPTGVHTYVFRYRADRMLGFFGEHDELYWNATGHEWAFPIDRARATVSLDFEGNPVILEADAFTGPMGARGSAFTKTVTGTRAEFTTTGTLVPHEGLTIVVTWPRGFVSEPGALQKASWLIVDNVNLMIALAGLFAMLAYFVPVWRVYGKDPEEGPVVTRYEPPEGFSPASLRFIRQMSYDNKMMTASIVNLAVKGYLRIEKDYNGDYTLTAADPGEAPPPLATGEKTLHDALFWETGTVVLDNENHALIGGARAAHRRSLRRDYRGRYFKTNGIYSLPALAVGGLTSVISLKTGLGPTPAVIAVIGAILIAFFVFNQLMRAPTIIGRKVLDEMRGFREYLEIAEKDELNLRNPPEKTPQLFEAYLPFALALGVEQQWAERFASVFEGLRGPHGAPYHPSWYDGSWDSIDLGRATAGLGRSLNSAVSSSAKPPGSSSGSGGGGSSGGGGGGGGGGGW